MEKFKNTQVINAFTTPDLLVHCSHSDVSLDLSPLWNSSASRGEEKVSIFQLWSALILNGLTWNSQKVPISANIFLTVSNSHRCRIVFAEKSSANVSFTPLNVIFFYLNWVLSVLELQETNEDCSVLVRFLWCQSTVESFQDWRLIGL